MIVPQPEKGQIVFHSFLWPYEAQKGMLEGVKDRPCLIISLRSLKSGKQRAVILPVSHSEPKNKAEAIELPTNIKKMLDLDARQSWVWLKYPNIFTWPGGDLRPAPGSNPPATLVGKVPPGYLQTVSERYLKLFQENKLIPVYRKDDIGNERSFRHGSPKAS